MQLKYKESAGVTLIELLVTLVVLAVLVLSSVTLGRAWIANSKISKAENILLQSFQQVRAISIRNAGGKTGLSTISTLDVSAAPEIAVYDNSYASPILVWKIIYDSDVIIILSNTSCLGKLSLNNLGLANTTQCLDYTISSSGGTTVNGVLR